MSFSPHSKNMSDWANIINGKDGWFDEVENMDCANVIKFRYYQYAKSLYQCNNKSAKSHYLRIFNIRSCQTTSGKVIGHYTQMVWAETTHVGCAAIGYYDDYNGYPFTPGQPHKQFYICNYSPRGNAPNKSVYKVDYSSSAYSDCPNQPE
jgi:hypothetical protein